MHINYSLRNIKSFMDSTKCTDGNKIGTPYTFNSTTKIF